MVEPSDAGSMSGTGTTGTFTAATGWTGAYTIKVRAENDCGNSSYSSTLTHTLTQVQSTKAASCAVKRSSVVLTNRSPCWFINRPGTWLSSRAENYPTASWSKLLLFFFFKLLLPFSDRPQKMECRAKGVHLLQSFLTYLVEKTVPIQALI